MSASALPFFFFLHYIHNFEKKKRSSDVEMCQLVEPHKKGGTVKGNF